jgi:hypothetical protein
MSWGADTSLRGEFALVEESGKLATGVKGVEEWTLLYPTPISRGRGKVSLKFATPVISGASIGMVAKTGKLEEMHLNKRIGVQKESVALSSGAHFYLRGKWQQGQYVDTFEAGDTVTMEVDTDDKGPLEVVVFVNGVETWRAEIEDDWYFAVGGNGSYASFRLLD